MTRRFTLTALLLTASLSPAGAQGPSVQPTSPSIHQYLQIALDAIRQQGLYADRVNWPSVDARAAQLARTAKTPADTYPLLRDVIAQMGERHTFLLEPASQAGAADPWYGFAQDGDGRVAYVDPQSMAFSKGLRAGDVVSYVFPDGGNRATVTWRRPGGASTQTSVTSSARPAWFPPQGRALPDGVALLAMFPVSGLTAGTSGLQAYATRTQAVIGDLQVAATCGWILDLRTNTGGTSYAMTMGVGPLLDPAARMFFKGRTETLTVTYQGGQEIRAENGGPARSFAGFQVDRPVTLSSPPRPVAVLQGPITASSGEATALLFKGRPDPRFFGSASAGFTTGNSPLTLPDGSTLVLTTSRMLDRAGTYNAVLKPDEVVEPGVDPVTGEDLTLRRAQAWLKETCARPK